MVASDSGITNLVKVLFASFKQNLLWLCEGYTTETSSILFERVFIASNWKQDLKLVTLGMLRRSFVLFLRFCFVVLSKCLYFYAFVHKLLCV